MSLPLDHKDKCLKCPENSLKILINNSSYFLTTTKIQAKERSIGESRQEMFIF
jgi:hypothetical protein